MLRVPLLTVVVVLINPNAARTHAKNAPAQITRYSSQMSRCEYPSDGGGGGSNLNMRTICILFGLRRRDKIILLPVRFHVWNAAEHITITYLAGCPSRVPRPPTAASN